MAEQRTVHQTCREAFRAMCIYEAEHLSYKESTPAQQAEYARLVARYEYLQRIVDDAAIARYEAAWARAIDPTHRA